MCDVHRIVSGNNGAPPQMYSVAEAESWLKLASEGIIPHIYDECRDSLNRRIRVATESSIRVNNSLQDGQAGSNTTASVSRDRKVR